jgi:hypothetical protein
LVAEYSIVSSQKPAYIVANLQLLTPSSKCSHDIIAGIDRCQVVHSYPPRGRNFTFLSHWCRRFGTLSHEEEALKSKALIAVAPAEELTQLFWRENNACFLMYLPYSARYWRFAAVQTSSG